MSGGTLVSIDAVTNQQVATLGTVPQGAAVFLSDTFRNPNHNGFIEATNSLSTGNPATWDLYILNTRQSNSLTRATGA